MKTKEEKAMHDMDSQGIQKPGLIKNTLCQETADEGGAE